MLWTCFRRGGIFAKNTGWAKKTGPVSALITQRLLVVERHVIRQKFYNAVRNKAIK